MDSYGRPGGYATTLAVRAATRTAVWAGVASTSVAFAVVSTFAGNGPPSVGPFQLIPAVLAAGAGIKAHAVWGAVGRALVGRRSERRVARAIGRCGATAVVHGALIGAGGDADHIVLGPSVALVETKTGGGVVHVDGNGRLVTLHSGPRGAHRRTIPGDPLGQAKRQADQLSRLARHPAHAVVCIPDMTNAPFRAGLVVVTSLRDLPKLLAGLPSGLAAPDARRLAKELHDRHTTEEQRRSAAKVLAGRR